jgi:hypothetical protein
MTAWDPVTGNNTVVIGSTTYTNLPSLSPNGLTVGPVMVQRSAAGWVVMGMVAKAGQAGDVDPLRWRMLPGDLSTGSTTLSDATGLAFVLNSYRRYALDGVLFMESPGAADLKLAWNGPVNMVTTRWGMYGTASATSGTSGNLQSEVHESIGDGDFQVMSGAGAPSQCRPAGTFETGDTPGLLQLRWAQNAASGTSFLRAGSRLSCADMGLAGTSTSMIKQYVCTASRSYDTVGDPIGGSDGDNNCYQGIFGSRGFGNEKSLMIFPGSTIRSDLSGASLLAARLYLYCFISGDSTGSCAARSEPNTSVPATYNSDSSQATLNHAWPVPGWQSLNALTLVGNILGGDNAIGLTERVISGYETGFRGYGFGASTRPYLEITYV